VTLDSRLPEDDLAAGVRAGEQAAFATLYQRYGPDLARYARRRLGNRGSAAVDDIAQDVFLSALRALPGDDRPIPLRPWLYRVTHNRCIDELKQATPEPLPLGLTGPTDPGAGLDARERLATLLEDIGALPPRQQRALVLRELCGLRYAAIAAELETSVPAVKSLLARAREALDPAR
jgi:RNA polymerase sigma factor (sigma-70 family)